MLKRFCILIFIVGSSWADPLIIATSPTIHDFFPDIETKIMSAFSLAGIEAELVNYPSERGAFLVSKGLVDGDAFRLSEFGNEVENIIAIDVPVQLLELSIVVSKSSDFYTNEQLVGRKMGVSGGVKAHDLIAKKLNATPLVLDEMHQVVKMLDAGRLDFTVLSPEITTQFRDQGYDFRIIEPPILTLNFHTWLHNSHADLIPQLNVVYQKVFSEKP